MCSCLFRDGYSHPGIGKELKSFEDGKEGGRTFILRIGIVVHGMAPMDVLERIIRFYERATR